MYRTAVEKKLRVAKKAWKRFSNTLHSKFRNLHISKSIKTATRRVISTFRRPLCRLIRPKLRRRFRASRSSVSSYYDHRERKQKFQQQNHRIQNQQDLPAIHIDELFADREKVVEEKESMYSIEDAWNAVVASSAHLRPVDERAEKFIRKFRRDIMLEKEKSFLEFQEMLARSA